MTYFMIYGDNKAIREEFPCCPQTKYIYFSINIFLPFWTQISFFPLSQYFFFSYLSLCPIINFCMAPLSSHLYSANSSNSSCLTDTVIPGDLNLHHSTKTALAFSHSVEWIYVPPVC